MTILISILLAYAVIWIAIRFWYISLIFLLVAMWLGVGLVGFVAVNHLYGPSIGEVGGIGFLLIPLIWLGYHPEVLKGEQS